MLYEQEWEFFLKTMDRFELQYLYLKKDRKEVDLGFRSLVGLKENLAEIYWEFVQYLKEGVIYHLTDHFFFTYLFLVLPEKWEHRYFLVGPYLSMRPSQKKIWEMAEAYQIPITRVEKMEEFYTRVPTIPDDSLFYAMIYMLCEKLWEHELRVQKLDINWEISQHESYHPSQTAQNRGALLKAMEQVERRYELEEQMIHAVSLGDMTILDKFSSPRFISRRLADPVRNWKNYCIIMNTILRKAVQQGGVHPYDLDRVSSQFAEKIELLQPQTKPIS